MYHNLSCKLAVQWGHQHCKYRRTWWQT